MKTIHIIKQSSKRYNEYFLSEHSMCFSESHIVEICSRSEEAEDDVNNLPESAMMLETVGIGALNTVLAYLDLEPMDAAFYEGYCIHRRYQLSMNLSIIFETTQELVTLKMMVLQEMHRFYDDVSLCDCSPQ